MEMVDKILKHPKFIRYMKLNSKYEKRRRFCCHDMKHAVDVARVSYIVALENNSDISKDVIYSTALLHDIARWKQYSQGVDHAAEGAVLAEEILKDIGVESQDIDTITDAIRGHRYKESKSTELGAILYTGDKACRPCTQCNMADKCNWYVNGRKPSFEY